MTPWVGTFVDRVREFHLPQWEELPDLGLYMDQVITYLDRQFRPLFPGNGRIMTPSMINNYVKGGLIARPVGKKYERPQLAQLAMLCALKQSLSLDDLRLLLTPPPDETVEAIYRAFCDQLAQAEQVLSSQLEALTPMRSAVMGAAYTLLCEEILHAGTETEG